MPDRAATITSPMRGSTASATGPNSVGRHRRLSRQHPGAAGLGVLPPVQQVHPRAVLGIEMQHPRFAADVPDPLQQVAPLRQKDMAVTRNVDHPVIRGHQRPGSRCEGVAQSAGRGIHPLERRDPLV